MLRTRQSCDLTPGVEASRQGLKTTGGDVSSGWPAMPQGCTGACVPAGGAGGAAAGAQPPVAGGLGRRRARGHDEFRWLGGGRPAPSPPPGRHTRVRPGEGVLNCPHCCVALVPAVQHQLAPVVCGSRIVTRLSHRSAGGNAGRAQVLVEAEEAARSRRPALSPESLAVDLRCVTGWACGDIGWVGCSPFTAVDSCTVHLCDPGRA